METLQKLLPAVTAHGDKPALVALRKHDSEVWSFAQLGDRAHRLADGLARAGLTRGARALVFAPNGEEGSFL
jgi:non-ribosomal peptide synthetase component E (peptide arylation enzyme)